MADQVQASLDQMVPALRDLLDRGIFTQVRCERMKLLLGDNFNLLVAIFSEVKLT
jgi:hypothetical protein